MSCTSKTVGHVLPQDTLPSSGILTSSLSSEPCPLPLLMYIFCQSSTQRSSALVVVVLVFYPRISFLICLISLPAISYLFSMSRDAQRPFFYERLCPENNTYILSLLHELAIGWLDDHLYLYTYLSFVFPSLSARHECYIFLLSFAHFPPFLALLTLIPSLASLARCGWLYISPFLPSAKRLRGSPFTFLHHPSEEIFRDGMPVSLSVFFWTQKLWVYHFVY